MTDAEKIHRSMPISEARLDEIESDPAIDHVSELVTEVRRLRDGLALIEAECMRTSAAIGGALHHTFEEGAKQMRAAASKHLADDAAGESLHMSIAAEIYSKVIAALPLPEYRDE